MRRRKQAVPSKPYDVTTKALIEQNPRAWLEFLGLPVTECEVINADLSTVSTEADKLIKVTSPILYGVHEEFQASAELRMPDRLLRYNILAEDRHQIPIQSILYVLRRQADRFGNLTGVLERKDIDGELMVWYRYRVVRVYEIPVDRILDADPSLLPLALLSDLKGTTPESVVRRMDTRLQQDVTPEQARLLWTSTYLLMGLSYPADVTDRLLSGVMQMRESVTYQKILSEGRLEGRLEGEAIGVAKGEVKGAVREAQNMLLLAGKGLLGVPDAATKKRIHSITEVEALESMVERIHVVGSWADLLK